MITNRQEMLLKLIIEEYMKTAIPVSSKSLSETMSCSSATIRNEMALLESIGLIEKTHISSGRVPSSKGYRYYVDNIMVPGELTDDDMEKIERIFANNSLALNDAVTKSIEIISEITNYAAIALGNSSLDNKVAKIEVIPISDTKMIAIIVTDKGHVENRNVVLNEDVSKEEIRKTVDLINKLIVGVPIAEVSKILEYEVKPVITKYIRKHETLYNAFYNAFSDFAHETMIKMSGTKNILMQPEFDSPDKIRQIISKFDDKNIVKRISESKSDMNIFIGEESEFDDEISIIKTSYYKDGEEGTIAIVGPKRMDYSKASALLEYIKGNIDR